MMNYIATALAGFGTISLLVFSLTLPPEYESEYSSEYLRKYTEEFSDPTYEHVYTPLEITEPRDYKIIECSKDPECSKLAEAIVYEARGESEANQLKVASVILNRVHHKNFPDSVIEVIEQPHQFSYLRDMHKQRTPPQSAWDKGYSTAYDAFFKELRTTEALFYLNPSKVKNLPKWAKVYTKIEIAGNHHFYTY